MLEDEELPEEAKKVRMAKDLGCPTANERREHEATHLPYRCWCKVCVAATGQALARRSQDHEDNTLLTASIDYAFPGETDEKGGIPILVARERKCKMAFAHVVKKKGADDYSVKRLLGDLKIL